MIVAFAAYAVVAAIAFAVLMVKRCRREWWPQALAAVLWPVMVVGFVQAVLIGAVKRLVTGRGCPEDEPAVRGQSQP